MPEKITRIVIRQIGRIGDIALANCRKKRFYLRTFCENERSDKSDALIKDAFWRNTGKAGKTGAAREIEKHCLGIVA